MIELMFAISLFGLCMWLLHRGCTTALAVVYLSTALTCSCSVVHADETVSFAAMYAPPLSAKLMAAPAPVEPLSFSAMRSPAGQRRPMPVSPPPPAAAPAPVATPPRLEYQRQCRNGRCYLVPVWVQ